MKYKKEIVITSVIILLFLVIMITTQSSRPKQICFETVCLDIDIAQTPEQLSNGLMGVTFLPPNSGMLFMFPEESTYSFWMKNTLIPLDIIWLSSDLEIVHIEHAIPCTEDPCQTYTPDYPARYVLETNLNFTVENSISLGDSIRLV